MKHLFALLLSICAASSLLAQTIQEEVVYADIYPQSEEVEIVNVHNVLRRLNGIPTGIISTQTCVNKTGCKKYCAYRGECNTYRVLKNISIAEIDEISYYFPDENNIPLYQETQEIAIANCLSDDWPWDEEVKIISRQRMTSGMKTLFRNVENKTIDLAVEANFMKLVGAKTSATFSNTTTVETSSDKVTEQFDEFTITKPLSMTVPPLTRRIIRYSDGKREAVIPVDINAVFDAEVYYVERVAKAFHGHAVGDVWYERYEGKLSATAGVPKRTIEGRAEIALQGSNRQLDIRLLEEKIDVDDPACQIRVSKAVPKVATTEASLRSCSASAKVQNYSQSGSNLSVVFDVSISDTCKKHNGEIEYTAIVEKADEFGEPLGDIETREGYAYWSNEEENGFLLDHDEYGFLEDGEIVQDISDVDVDKCTCIID